MDDSSVSTMLRDLAEAPAPPSRVDVSRAAAVGRRRVRARRLVTVGSAAAGLAAVVTVAGLLATGTPAPRSPVAAMPAAAPTQFDPLVQYAEPGWLPDGAPIESNMTIQHDVLELSAYYPATSSRDDRPHTASVHFVIAPVGQGVDGYFDLPTVPTSYEQTQVHGRPAWWAQNRSTTILRWEYAPRAWAGVEVSAAIPGVDDAREAARRVAENIRYGVDVRVRLPFVTTGVPRPFRVRQVEVSHGEQGSQAGVSYFNTVRPEGGYGEVTISTLPPVADPAPNTTVDGHPAWVATAPGPDGGSTLIVFDVDGITVAISTNDALTTAVLTDGLVGLFRATEFYADPADWR